MHQHRKTSAPREDADAPPPAVAFTDALDAAARQPGLRKGERTRREVRAAVARCLATTTYADLSMDQIAMEAGVSRSAVYQYVQSKADAVRDVLGDFQGRVLGISRAAKPEQSIFDGILATNRYYIDYFAENAVFMERVREVRHVLPELIAERQRVNAEWARRIVRHARKNGWTGLPTSALMLRALALECMIDDTLRELFVIGNPTIKAAAADRDVLARELTEIWWLSLYARQIEGVRDSDFPIRRRQRPF